MKAKEMEMIMQECVADFDKWYEEGCKNKVVDKEVLFDAYMDAQISLVKHIQETLCDNFFEDDGKEIKKGEGFSSWLLGAFTRRVHQCANNIIYSPMASSLENYHDLAMKQIKLILSAYSGKQIVNDDDDDGIEGEESEARHRVFDGTISAIAAVKEGILNKAALAKSFRALADFYEQEW